MELNIIHNRECIEGMKELIPDNSIDMILCDLPYEKTKNQWDKLIPLKPLWEQYERIIKDNGAIVLTAQTPFDKVLGASNLKLLKYEWIWQKEKGTGHLNAKKMPLRNHENILVFYKKLPVYNPQMRSSDPYYHGLNHKNTSTNYNEQKAVETKNDGLRYPLTVLYYKRESQFGESFTPTQKPVALFEYLIKTYTNDNAIILDNCIGSGTTALATLKAGGNRSFIGFEISEEYCDIARRRIKDLVGVK